MSPVRRLVIQCTIGGVLLGHLVCLLAGHQLWPFSHYPMFAESRRMPSVIRATVLVGVTGDGAERWLKGRRDLGRSLSPFLYAGPLGPQARARHGAPEVRRRLEEMLRYCNLQIARQDPGGDRLRGIRLYDVEWDPDPSLRNRANPRTLLVESWESGEHP
ncbi:MAG: hypothetical protein KF791_00495 [Verrucomicrobiae bacterium]|nr:hypothetical protein [Verrucomicrobiae bacterium]